MAQFPTPQGGVPNSVLETSLATPLLTSESRHAFAQDLFHRSFQLEKFQPPRMESYFRYYHEQCAIVISDNQQTAKTHRDMLRIVHQLTEQGSNFTKTTLPVKDEEERYWMNFSVRILTMIDVGGTSSRAKVGTESSHMDPRVAQRIY
jgi:hypothetical protein